MTSTTPAGAAAPAGSAANRTAAPDPAANRTAAPDQAMAKLLRGAVDGGLAFVRKLDPDAAADLDAIRRREVTRPGIVVVGETKRGKSSLVNMLIGVPNLSPVDVAVATSAYLEFRHAPQPAAR